MRKNELLQAIVDARNSYNYYKTQARTFDKQAFTYKQKIRELQKELEEKYGTKADVLDENY